MHANVKIHAHVFETVAIVGGKQGQFLVLLFAPDEKEEEKKLAIRPNKYEMINIYHNHIRFKNEPKMVIISSMDLDYVCQRESIRNN